MNFIKVVFIFIALSFGLSTYAAKAHLSQFDRDIFEEISKRAGVNLKYGMYGTNISWQGLLDQVKDGHVQITGSATDVTHRKSWAKFTKPYRTEEVVLYVPNERQLNLTNVKDFMQFAKSHHLKLGIGAITGWVQPTPELDDFVQSPDNDDIFEKRPSDAEVAALLFENKVDGVLLERACSHDSELANNAKYKAIRIGAITPIAFILTKNGANAVSDEDITKLNKVIDQMTKSGELQQRFEEFLAH